MSKRYVTSKRWRSVREMQEGARDIVSFLTWHRESLELFHEYAQRFGGTPGSDVFLFVLENALRLQGMTLEQFKAWCRK